MEDRHQIGATLLSTTCANSENDFLVWLTLRSLLVPQRPNTVAHFTTLRCSG